MFLCTYSCGTPRVHCPRLIYYLYTNVELSLLTNISWTLSNMDEAKILTRFSKTWLLLRLPTPQKKVVLDLHHNLSPLDPIFSKTNVCPSNILLHRVLPSGSRATFHSFANIPWKTFTSCRFSPTRRMYSYHCVHWIFMCTNNGRSS